MSAVLKLVPEDTETLNVSERDIENEKDTLKIFSSGGERQLNIWVS